MLFAGCGKIIERVQSIQYHFGEAEISITATSATLTTDMPYVTVYDEPLEGSSFSIEYCKRMIQKHSSRLMSMRLWIIE